MVDRFCLAGFPSLDKIAGGTMTSAGGTIVIPLQIDSQAVGKAVIRNGCVVAQGTIAAMKSNAGRREMTALQQSSGTLVSYAARCGLISSAIRWPIASCATSRS